MGIEEQQKRFARFLERLIEGRIRQADWPTFVVEHYCDERLETVRRDLVRYAISQDGQWDPLALSEEQRTVVTRLRKQVTKQ
ncbi:hypothetical protein [Stratiformator vulcanicus]|uniref:Uncharacterized protein n=1 Tax=Stratiformator vulcanicus TaxID=2527980 RepID=A0A517R2J2_9PLAN|nr:hypothetical protein [Stratiformator vulcanicus]QDT38099.1 hypothetical protein Pan189_24890 [Stratiformator vulcanicus]